MNALSRVKPYMSLSKKKKLVNSCFNSQFNCLQERCLSVLYGDKSSSFEKLLEQDKSVMIHTRNLQILATEMFKVYRNVTPPIFSEIFNRRDKNFRFCNAKPKVYAKPKVFRT